ncbi:MAG: hypothetical protein K0Q62_1464 [Phenylobacterium sp.]|nr:hypothetical protein [Phenylobacterium sp.]
MDDKSLKLAELQAYDAMCEFLEAYWVARGKEDEDIAILLGGLSRELRRNGMPLDPVMWSDWKRAVGRVLARESPPNDFLSDSRA